jgi:cytochrome c-type biogenesis protein CcmH
MAARHSRGRRAVIGLAIALATTLSPQSAGAAETPANPPPRDALMIEIEESLVCQCGCGLTVHACNHLNCPSGIPIKEEVARRLAAGETKEQILAHFAERYGEKVLSAPTLRGFNLVAWIAPAAFVLLGGGFVAFVARRWTRQTRPAPATPSATAGSTADDPYREQLAREIREFDA